VVLTFSLDVLGFRKVVLEAGKGADEVLARRKPVDHWDAVHALQAVADLVPPGDTLVVPPAHRQLPAADCGHHALRYGGAAVHGERGRVDDHVLNRLGCRGAVHDPVGHFLGGSLDAHVGTLGPVPFAVHYERPFREHPAVRDGLTIAYGCPVHGERGSRPPVHCAHSRPGLRNLERGDDVLRRVELGEVRALDDAPVALQPGSNQFRRTEALQPVDVVGVGVQKNLVVLDPRRNEHSGGLRPILGCQ
jgi:hypothetical protein